LEMPSRGSKLNNFSPHYPVASPDRGFRVTAAGDRARFARASLRRKLNLKLKNFIYLFHFPENFTFSNLKKLGHLRVILLSLLR
jgi:hypothetical protein